MPIDLHTELTRADIAQLNEGVRAVSLDTATRESIAADLVARVEQEHLRRALRRHPSCVDAYDLLLRGRALQRLQLARSGGGERVLLAALPGQCHELELLVAGVLLSHAEVTLTVLPLGQPLEELTLVCEKLKPVALVVFSNHAPTAELPKRLKRLALTLDCPLMLAGDAADLAQESFSGSPVACLGNEGRLMQKRLRQFLSGRLDT